ncbi:MAG TPA: response regulator [Oculatellaceae cyanobacterium]
MDDAHNSPSVMIVDDDPNFRSLVKVLLQACGCQLLEARSARDADMILRDYLPSLLIVDYRLPGTDGIQWITKIREAGYNTPIIFLSGTWCDLKTFNNLRSLLRVNMILQKPIVPELFIEQIENLLPKRRSVSSRVEMQEEAPVEYPEPEVFQESQVFQDSQVLEETESQSLHESAYRAMEDELPAEPEPAAEMPPLPDLTKEKLRSLFEKDATGTQSIMPNYLVNPVKGKEVMRKSAARLPAFNSEEAIPAPHAAPPPPPPKTAANVDGFASVALSRDNAEEMAIINSEEPDELEQLSRFNQKAVVEMALRRARADYAKELPERVEALALAVKAYKDDISNSGAYDEAVQFAHQLKGTAGSLGFPHLGKTAGIVEALLRSGFTSDPSTAQKSWLQLERQVAQCLGIAESNAATYAGAEQMPRKAMGKKVAVVGPFIGFAKLTADLAFDDTAEAYLLDDSTELLAQAAKETFDAVIIDSAGLDEQSPTELLEKIRQHETLRNTPVSFIASENWHTDQALWFYTGAELVMPFNANQALLRSTVEEMLALRENSKPHILTVDDDVVLTNFICDTLSTHGMTAVAENEPINILNRLENYPADLILLDVVMPGVSGYDVCRMLRSQEKYASIPVLFLTSKNTQQGRAAAFRAGADDFLSKPILTEELLTRVRTRLELSQRYLQKAGKHSLTGMTTKQVFFEKLPSLVIKALNTRVPMTVAIVGIDSFPELAIECGFQMQERIFKDLASLLQARFRIEDLKAHWTEGSFALAFPGIDMSIAQQAVTILAGEFAISTTHNSSGNASASKRVLRYGLAELGTDGVTADSLLSRAYERCLKSEPIDVSALIASINDKGEEAALAEPTKNVGIGNEYREAQSVEADHIDEDRAEAETFEAAREAAERAENNEFEREQETMQYVKDWGLEAQPKSEEEKEKEEEEEEEEKAKAAKESQEDQPNLEEPSQSEQDQTPEELSKESSSQEPERPEIVTKEGDILQRKQQSHRSLEPSESQTESTNNGEAKSGEQEREREREREKEKDKAIETNGSKDNDGGSSEQRQQEDKETVETGPVPRRRRRWHET